MISDTSKKSRDHGQGLFFSEMEEVGPGVQAGRLA